MESSGQLFINNVDMVPILIYWTIIWITYMLIYQCAMVVNRGILLYKNIIVITGNIMLFVQLILFTAQTPQMLHVLFESQPEDIYVFSCSHSAAYWPQEITVSII